MATRKIVPRADDEGGIGTALKRWASAFITLLTVTSINKVGITAPTTAATIVFGVDNTTQTFQASDTIVGRATTDTLTNKRITPRITTIVNAAEPAVNTDDCDCVTITALATAITSMTTNLTGTPVNFQKLIFRILDDGTGRAITWGAKFVAKGVALPVTTVASKLLTVGFIYDAVATTWGCVASVQEA